MTERWLPVVGYDAYEVSDCGNVRRIKRNRFLTDAQFSEAKAMRVAGNTYARIGARFGVALHSMKGMFYANQRGERRGDVRDLKAFLDTHGYPTVGLCQKCVKRCHRVHRLVVEAFICPIPPGLTVNHKDGIRSNNNVANLEIATYQENNLHALRILLVKHKGPRGERAPKSKLKTAQVLDIRAAHAGGAKKQELARMYGVHISSIKHIVARKTWSHI